MCCHGADAQAPSHTEATRLTARPLIRPPSPFGLRRPPSPARGEGIRPLSRLRAIGFTHPVSKTSGSAVPDPCSASMSSPLRGLLVSLANIDPCARLRLSVSMIYAAQAGPAGRLRSAKIMEALRHIGPAQSPRSGRSAAEQPRSGLTATGRCGRRPTKMCECRSPLAGEGRGEGGARPTATSRACARRDRPSAPRPLAAAGRLPRPARFGARNAPAAARG